MSNFEKINQLIDKILENDQSVRNDLDFAKYLFNVREKIDNHDVYAAKRLANTITQFSWQHQFKLSDDLTELYSLAQQAFNGSDTAKGLGLGTSINPK